MGTYSTQGIGSGALASVTGDTTLATVGAGKRWLVSSFCFQAHFTSSGGASTLKIFLGDLCVYSMTLTNSDKYIPPLNPDGSQGYIDLNQSMNPIYSGASATGQYASSMGPHNAKGLEAAKTVTIVKTGGGDMDLDGSWEITGVEETI
jgi:hypothetical protein